VSKRTDTHARIIDDLTHHTPAQVADAIRRLMDARPALPGAASTDGTRGRGGSSSVEALALNVDPVAAEIKELDRLLRRLEVDALRLRSLIGRYQPRTATAKDQVEVDRQNAEPLPECFWMRRCANTFEPALCTSNLGGLLDVERPVCRWVYDFARRMGRLPGAEECQRHAAGQKVRVVA